MISDGPAPLLVAAEAQRELYASTRPFLSARARIELARLVRPDGFFLKPVSLIYPFLGLIMFAFYRTHADTARLMRIPDDALPVFVMNVLPAGARGLMTIAMVAAVLTSVQSGLAAVSAAIQVNFVKPRMARPLSDREAVLLARVLLLLTGICILAIACWVRTLGQQNSIVNVSNIIMYPFSGVLLGIFLLGLLSHRANSYGVLIGGILGILGTIAMPAFEYLSRISNFYYGFIAALLTIVTGYAASMLFPPPPQGNIVGFTRRSMPQPVEHREVEMIR